MSFLTSLLHLDLPAYDDHRTPHHDVTVPQLTIFNIWVGAVILWLYRNIRKVCKNGHIKEMDVEAASKLIETKNGGSHKKLENMESEAHNSSENYKEPSQQNGDLSTFPKDSDNSNVVVTVKKQSDVTLKQTSSIPPAPTFDRFLLYLIALGLIMFYFWLCDYRKIFRSSPRVYTRDTFLFLVFLLFLVGVACTLRPAQDKILNRDQTEEWKGWMQVMFIWYHYFAAAEWYNWIRVYIAAYVWMTGFGNFSFFWIRGDYSLWRAAKMLWRLNFLVLVICATVSNVYMLYYICAMHTYWFLSVYAVMGIYSSWNTHRWKMMAKFGIYAVINALIFDVPGNSEIVFRPLYFLLGFKDNKHSIMHEWAFRAGLDHWVCFIGMLCAYNYPRIEALMARLDSTGGQMGSKTRAMLKMAVAVFCVIIYAIWHCYILKLDKFSYNKLHPYTSWMPLLSFIALRNMISAMRTKYVHMFAWLGKITLETYLSQLHIYLQSNAKGLIEYIPGAPLLNFALATIIYLCLSHALFNITVELSSFLLPKDLKQLSRHVILTLLLIVLSVGVAIVIKFI